jgi:tetratricopeptide (TPR) repeat protein
LVTTGLRLTNILESPHTYIYYTGATMSKKIAHPVWDLSNGEQGPVIVRKVEEGPERAKAVDLGWLGKNVATYIGGQPVHAKVAAVHADGTYDLVTKNGEKLDGVAEEFISFLAHRDGAEDVVPSHRTAGPFWDKLNPFKKEKPKQQQDDPAFAQDQDPTPTNTPIQPDPEPFPREDVVDPPVQDDQQAPEAPPQPPQAPQAPAAPQSPTDPTKKAPSAPQPENLEDIDPSTEEGKQQLRDWLPNGNMPEKKKKKLEHPGGGAEFDPSNPVLIGENLRPMQQYIQKYMDAENKQYLDHLISKYEKSRGRPDQVVKQRIMGDIMRFIRSTHINKRVQNDINKILNGATPESGDEYDRALDPGEPEEFSENWQKGTPTGDEATDSAIDNARDYLRSAGGNYERAYRMLQRYIDKAIEKKDKTAEDFGIEVMKHLQKMEQNKNQEVGTPKQPPAAKPPPGSPKHTPQQPQQKQQKEYAKRQDGNYEDPGTQATTMYMNNGGPGTQGVYQKTQTQAIESLKAAKSEDDRAYWESVLASINKKRNTYEPGAPKAPKNNGQAPAASPAAPPAAPKPAAPPAKPAATPQAAPATPPAAPATPPAAPATPAATPGKKQSPIEELAKKFFLSEKGNYDNAIGAVQNVLDTNTSLTAEDKKLFADTIQRLTDWQGSERKPGSRYQQILKTQKGAMKIQAQNLQRISELYYVMSILANLGFDTENKQAVRSILELRSDPSLTEMVDSIPDDQWVQFIGGAFRADAPLHEMARHRPRWWQRQPTKPAKQQAPPPPPPETHEDWLAPMSIGDAIDPKRYPDLPEHPDYEAPPPGYDSPVTMEEAADEWDPRWLTMSDADLGIGTQQPEEEDITHPGGYNKNRLKIKGQLDEPSQYKSKLGAVQWLYWMSEAGFPVGQYDAAIALAKLFPGSRGAQEVPKLSEEQFAGVIEDGVVDQYGNEVEDAMMNTLKEPAAEPEPGAEPVTESPEGSPVKPQEDKVMQPTTTAAEPKLMPGFRTGMDLMGHEKGSKIQINKPGTGRSTKPQDMTIAQAGMAVFVKAPGTGFGYIVGSLPNGNIVVWIKKTQQVREVPPNMVEQDRNLGNIDGYVSKRKAMLELIRHVRAQATMPTTPVTPGTKPPIPPGTSSPQNVPGAPQTPMGQTVKPGDKVQPKNTPPTQENSGTATAVDPSGAVTFTNQKGMPTSVPGGHQQDVTVIPEAPGIVN